MNKVDNVKEVIDFLYPRANCGIFNCKGVGNDPMSTVYDKDGVRVDICYEYMYFEVFGLTEEEFSEVEEYYNSLEDSYSGAPGKEISSSKSSCKTCGYYEQCKENYGFFISICDVCHEYEPKISDATNFMAGPHKVESKMTNFDVELQKVKVEELAYLRSRWTPCESCPLVDECVKDELTCLDLWVRYLKEEVK